MRAADPRSNERLRNRLLGAIAPALPLLALGGCCNTAEVERCLPANEDTTCPSPEVAAAELDAVSVDGEGRYEPEATLEADGEPWVQPAQCCYDATVVQCPNGARGFGRPFVLASGRSLTAPLAHGDTGGWVTRRGGPDVQALDAATRRRLARQWTDRGLAEHAAIVSLGRFALELMRFGAGPDLVLAAQHAAADEVRHARICLSIASEYAGHSLSPQAFPLGESVPLATDLHVFARALAAEGCLGETLGVVDLAERRAHATEPAVVAALTAIVSDERRHASLAWSSLAWSLARLPPTEGRAIVDALRRPLVIEVRESEPDLRSDHGELPGALVAASLRAAHAEVVVPCADALARALRCGRG